MTEAEANITFAAFLVALFNRDVRHPADGVSAIGWLGSKIPALAATHAGGHL